MSITYRLLLILLITVCSAQLFAQSSASPQTERHYRVELLVVRHLEGSSDTAPQQSLRDFTEIFDLNAPFDEEDETGAVELQETSQHETSEALLDEDMEPAEPDEPLATRIDDMSDTMREAWRRLRLSAGFRPELFRAWEQSGDQPFPVLRIHDDEVLFEIDPALQSLDAPVDEYGALVFSDATLDSKAIGLAADGKGKDDESMEEEKPPIRYYYRIDGTASLSRSRFLHLDLDVELREPLFVTELPLNAVPSNPASRDIQEPGTIHTREETAPSRPETRSGPAAEAGAFRIHRIKQRRQVRTEQMEYFDGPVIGVLAFVTGFDVNQEETLP